MATLTGTQIANTYKQLLQVGSGNNGLTASVQTVQDGQGNNSALQLSQSAVNIDGTFQLNGITLTANASALNNIADLTGATGIIAVSGGSVYGRTLTGGTGVSITNADGTEGNPTIVLNTTGVVSGSYGPFTNIEINSVGQVVSAGAATSVSVSGVTANTFTGGTFAGTTGDFSSNVSVGGNLVIAGQFSPASLSVTGTINAAKISATDATFNSIVSAGFFVGDGSGLVNVPSAEGGTLKAITAGTGIKLTIDAAVTTTIPVSGTVAVSANQNFGSVSVSTALAVTGSALFGIVSATNIDTDELLIAGVSAATVTEVAAVSALTQTNLDSITSISALTQTNLDSITSINTVVANVSALTSVNAAAITSINGLIGGTVSAASGTFNTLTVVTSASVGGTLNVGGNVGIGTSSPLKKLDVSSGVAEIAINSTGSSYSRVNHYHNGTAVWTTGTRTTSDYHIYRESGGGNVIIDLGNVGIGNAAPSYLLDLYKAASTVARIRNSAATGGTPSVTHGEFVIESTDANMGMEFLGSTTADQRILFSDTATASGQIRYNHTSNYMALSANGSERLRIDSSGNVGIGTTSVSSLGAINTPSFGLFSSSGSRLGIWGNGGRWWYLDAELANKFEIGFRGSSNTTDNNVLTINTSGNVGIGRTSPTNKLEVDGAAVLYAASTETRNFEVGYGRTGNGFSYVDLIGDATYTDYGLRILRNNTGPNTSSVIYHRGTGDFSIITQEAANITLRTANTERMRISSSGNVGIGTTSPDTLFTVNGQAIIGNLVAGSANLTNFLSGTPPQLIAGWSIPAVTWSPNSATEAVFTRDGDMFVDILASNTTNSRIQFSDTDAEDVGWIDYDHADNNMNFRVNASEALRIDSSGNLLVGTTSQTTDLAYSPKLKLSGSGPGLYFEETDTSQDYAITALGGKFYIRDATAVVPRLTIDSSGNVGIGTTAPAQLVQISKATSAGTTSLLVSNSSGTGGSSAALKLGVSPEDNSVAKFAIIHERLAAYGGGDTYFCSNYAANTTEVTDADAVITIKGSTGNVGIGTTSPDYQLDVSGTTDPRIILQSTGTASTDDTIFMNRVGGTTATNQIWFGDSGSAATGKLQYDHSNNAMTFHTNGGTERMRIDSSGNVGIGTTSSVGTDSTGQGFWFDVTEAARFSRSSNPCLILNRLTTTGIIQSIRSDGSEVGSISYDGEFTNFNGTSDYRLKENVVNLSGAIDRVKLLKPSRFNFITNPDRTVDGFVAHEVSDIVPEAVHGEKDAVDADGNPEYQGIDQSRLVPVLTAALQEALTKIEALEARIVALETA